MLLAFLLGYLSTKADRVAGTTVHHSTILAWFWHTGSLERLEQFPFGEATLYLPCETGLDRISTSMNPAVVFRTQEIPDGASFRILVRATKRRATCPEC